MTQQLPQISFLVGGSGNSGLHGGAIPAMAQGRHMSKQMATPRDGQRSNLGAPSLLSAGGAATLSSQSPPRPRKGHSLLSQYPHKPRVLMETERELEEAARFADAIIPGVALATAARNSPRNSGVASNASLSSWGSDPNLPTTGYELDGMGTSWGSNRGRTGSKERSGSKERTSMSEIGIASRGSKESPSISTNQQVMGFPVDDSQLVVETARRSSSKEKGHRKSSLRLGRAPRQDGRRERNSSHLNVAPGADQSTSDSSAPPAPRQGSLRLGRLRTSTGGPGRTEDAASELMVAASSTGLTAAQRASHKGSLHLDVSTSAALVDDQQIEEGAKESGDGQEAVPEEGGHDEAGLPALLTMVASSSHHSLLSDPETAPQELKMRSSGGALHRHGTKDMDTSSDVGDGDAENEVSMRYPLALDLVAAEQVSSALDSGAEEIKEELNSTDAFVALEFSTSEVGGEISVSETLGGEASISEAFITEMESGGANSAAPVAAPDPTVIGSSLGRAHQAPAARGMRPLKAKVPPKDKEPSSPSSARSSFRRVKPSSDVVGRAKVMAASVTSETSSARDNWLRRVAVRGEALSAADMAVRRDRTVALAAVTSCGRALQFASENLRRDREVVLTAVKQDGYALRFAGPGLSSDREVVLAAVAQNGLALSFAEKPLQADPEVVLTATQQDGRALQFAGDSIRRNRHAVYFTVNSVEWPSRAQATSKEDDGRWPSCSDWSPRSALKERRRARV